jgi:hypothetical protein
MPKHKTTQMSEEEVLKHITCYDAPPEDFDPFTADARLLQKHGIPRRPHPENEAHLRAIWDRAFKSKPKFIKAKVSVDPIMSKRKRHVLNAKANAKDNAADFSPHGWAGAVQQVSNFGFNPPEPVVTVYGEWFISTVTPVANEPNTAETVGFWVGIDGYDNGQVLQAGSATTITGSNPVYWVWTEWYPIGAIRVDNFPINPGDYLTVLVCAFTPTHGFCSMMNKTTNQVTSIGITNPADTSSIGSTAEWIVEGISDILPVFSTVVFANCSAGTKNHTINTQNAIITEITGDDGSDLTYASVLSDNRVMVKWLEQS